MADALAIGCAACGVLVVRLGWQGKRAVALGGWALVLAALSALAGRAGAWGIAVGGLAAMAAAMVMLARSVWVAPAGTFRPQRSSARIAPPRWPVARPGRRFAIFLLVVPIGFAAAQLLAFGAQVAARRGGWDDADSLALALLLQPIAWAALASVQMTRAEWGAMIVPALVCGAAGLAMWCPL